VIPIIERPGSDRPLILRACERAVASAVARAHGIHVLPERQCVYFIQSGDDGGPIKIGRAVNPLERLLGLQVGNPHRLQVIACTKPMRFAAALELCLHMQFNTYRLRGEWFHYSDLLHSVADEVCFGVPFSEELVAA